MCCSPWGSKESDTTERLFRTELIATLYLSFPGGSDGKESTCGVGDLGITKGHEQIWGDKRYVHYFESSDGFTSVYLCQNSSNGMLCMCKVNGGYTSIKLPKLSEDIMNFLQIHF